MAEKANPMLSENQARYLPSLNIFHKIVPKENTAKIVPQTKNRKEKVIDHFPRLMNRGKWSMQLLPLLFPLANETILLLFE